MDKEASSTARLPVNMPKIDVRNVYKIFGPRPEDVLPLAREGLGKEEILERTGHTLGLRDISLTVEAGEIFVVMGLSGSGKSTLLRHLNRLIEPTAGQVIVDDTDVLALTDDDLIEFRRRRTSMVFQHFGLLPHRSVLDNVAYGLAVQDIDRQDREEIARRWIDAVGLSGYEDAWPDQLSGGMQQRVGLARALATDAEILLMDEPFGALDPLIRRDMQDQLAGLQATLHKTILFITHDLEEALRLGDRLAILKDGRLVQSGRPEEILLHPVDDYVEAFVKDVYRGRILSAKTVMANVTPVTQSTDCVGAAMDRIEAGPLDVAYVIDDAHRLQGIVTADDARQALAGEDRTLDGALRESPSAGPDSSVEVLLPLCLQVEWPVPIVDGDGRLLGIVDRPAVMTALGLS